MLHTKFQVPEPSGSEGEDILIFSMYFCDSKAEPPWAGVFWTRGPPFAKSW